MFSRTQRGRERLEGSRPLVLLQEVRCSQSDLIRTVAGLREGDTLGVVVVDDSCRRHLREMLVAEPDMVSVYVPFEGVFPFAESLN